MDVPTLTDGEVTLDALQLDDAASMAASWDEPTRWAFGDVGPMTVGGAERQIVKAISQWGRRSPVRTFAIRRNGLYAGRLLLRPRKPVYLLEIVVHPDHRKAHIGRRAAHLGCRYAFDELEATLLEVETRIGHLAAQRVAIAVGFEGVQPEQIRETPSGARMSVAQLPIGRWRALESSGLNPSP